MYIKTYVLRHLIKHATKKIKSKLRIIITYLQKKQEYFT